MKTAKLSAMTKGWFIGNFSPTLHATEAVEVGIKHYPSGSTEQWHYHKIATEFTAIVSGEVEMNGKRYCEGDIIEIAPGEGTNFVTLKPTVTVVVKLPSVVNDKYLL